MGYSELNNDSIHSPNTKKRSRKVNGQLVIKGNSEMFGYEEILNESHVREHTVVCVTRIAEVYHISKEDFLSRIPHPETWNMLREKHIRDTNWRDKRLIDLKNLETLKQSLTFEPSLRNSLNSPRLSSNRESYDDSLKIPTKYIIKKNPQVQTREKYKLRYNHPIRSLSRSTRPPNINSPSPEPYSKSIEAKKSDSNTKNQRSHHILSREDREKQTYTPFCLEKKLHTRRRLPPPNFFASPPKRTRCYDREPIALYDSSDDISRRDYTQYRQYILKQSRGSSYRAVRLPKVDEKCV